MLHRSFKSAKCKTALKLAVSRIKLLKNKREAQAKQHKRELARLLESGQDRTARIRVEHVVREEKTMAAYDLIEIYCELISARLPMIESQKTCPIDLKEAIASVIFASPRCSDIPELMEVRKHITAKYGKEFISAAVELRPDCGVNRLLVEKLSAKAPDGPTKMKILTAIAEEHNVKWEPKSFGESDVKSSQDLLVGPNTYEKATYVEPPQVHVPPVIDEKGPPNLHSSSQYKEMQDISANLDENANFAVKKVGGNKSATSGGSNLEIKSSDTYSENRRDFPMGRQNWNTEFKDAASAAQAAAESAERASMAARVAAELSNREKITRQYSSGSQSSFGSGLRGEVPQEFAFHDDKHLSTGHAGMAARAADELSNHEKITGQYSTGSQSSYKSNKMPQEYAAFHDEKQISTGSINSTFCSSSSGMHNEQINTREQDKPVGVPEEYYRDSHENAVKHTQSTSLTSNSPFGDDNPFGYDSNMANIYPHNNSFEQENSDFLQEMSMKKQASRTEVDFVNQLHGNMNTESIDNFGYGRMDRQSSKASSSYFLTPSDDPNDVLKLNSPKMGNNTGGDLFVTDEGNTRRNSLETHSYNDTAVMFDDSASEDDDYKFVVDKTNEEQGSGSFISSPGSKSQMNPSANENAWSAGQVADEKEGSSSSQLHFSDDFESLRKSAVSSGKEDLLPVTFDDSDGPSSDSEEDLIKSKVSGSYGHGNSVADQSVNHGALGSSSRNDKNVYSDRKSWLSSSTADTFNKTETLEESHIESGKELNYETLKGGLRNKGYRQPRYLKSSAGKVSSSLGDNLVQNEPTLPTERTSISTDARAQDTYVGKVRRGNRSIGMREQYPSFDSDNYDLVLNSQDTMTSTRDPHIQKGEESKSSKKSSSKPSITYFDSDSSYSDDEVPKQNSVNLAHPVSGFSQRTTASSKSGAGLSSNTSVTSGAGLGWKSSRVPDESANQKIASSRMKASNNLATSEHESAGQAAFKPTPESNRSSHEVTKSSARVQPSSSSPKTLIPDNVEASGSSNTDGDTPSKEKASHVHPKLPDYESFAAHFLSLKKGGK